MSGLTHGLENACVSRREFLGGAAAGSVAVALSPTVAVQDASVGVPAPADTTWFKDARWGVFTHCLTAAQTAVDEWNTRVDAFDTAALAAQLAATGAKYYFITIGQNSGHYCAPNETYDRLSGVAPSKCSKRDLIADIAAALEPHRIRLMVYLPSGAPAEDKEACRNLEWRWGHQEDWPGGGALRKERLAEFQSRWEAIIREWSLRWGKNVHGWWIDGCYFADDMYRAPDAPNFASFAAALKAGNPDSLVAFNPGVIVPVICHSEYEDYTAGEIADEFPVHGSGRPLGRWVERDGHRAQFHILSYLGEFWGNATRRFTDDMAAAYTRHINAHEGVITWDVPITPAGTIPQDFVDQLTAIGRAAAG